ncbi:hypothetical protein BU23DRAFT_573490 [Bimuria novae-zelandiae CBS 107.79]|uniref:Uncharacterized protein n=1 Tax=Bimuria novae-zelandiae CBS 107.79 TaxID=1447943 RepID=A0A6A5UTN3_9PLEO|nr:hypothetical protein BU23DRAFT_573490 [Bimuria novae-zelandiae CBS 107.79]
MLWTLKPQLPPNTSFLELTPEVRNEVCSIHFTIDGAISPWNDGGSTNKRKAKGSTTTISSVLSLLQTNKQMNKENRLFFYQNNKFVFYASHKQLRNFFGSMNYDAVRISSLEDITIWVRNAHYRKKPNVTVLDTIMHLLRLCGGLNRLPSVLLPNSRLYLNPLDLVQLQADQLPQLKELRRKGVEISIKCPRADFHLWTLQNRSWSDPRGTSTRTAQDIADEDIARRTLAKCADIERLIREDTPPPSPHSSADEDGNDEDDAGTMTILSKRRPAVQKITMTLKRNNLRPWAWKLLLPCGLLLYPPQDPAYSATF